MAAKRASMATPPGLVIIDPAAITNINPAYRFGPARLIIFILLSEDYILIYMSQAWIKFRCIYCGQLIRTPSNTLGKVGKCPRCKHTIRVLDPARKALLKAQLAAQRKPKPELKCKPPIEQQESPSAFVRWMKQIFIPSYNELSLFLMSFTAILILLANHQLSRNLILFTGINFRYPTMYISLLIIMVAAGMFFSVYHIFTRKPKEDYQLFCMLLFAIIANAGSAILAGRYLLEQTTNKFLMVFPMWNIINGLYLVALLRAGCLTIDNITDEQATLMQVIVGTITALIVFLICQFGLKLYWPITFSICIAFATGFSRAIQEIICPKVRALERFA